MPRVIPIIVALLLSGDAAAQKTVSFPTDDRGIVYADAYGEGDTGIVLAHVQQGELGEAGSNACDVRISSVGARLSWLR